MDSHLLESKIIDRLKALQLPIGVALPSGGSYSPAVAADVMIIIHDKRAILPFVTGNIGQIGSDYIAGYIDIVGDLRKIMALVPSLLKDNPTKPSITSVIKTSIVNMLYRSAATDAKNIEFHYDVSDDFYKLWLDPRRVYSCAYYKTPRTTLAEAQEAKLDHICRKLMLKPGDSFLDIGAGWGGLLFHAAESYGVKADGITLSKNQHAYVNEQIVKRGLQNRVRMLLCDYRDIQGKYDKIASVGMFEHVGRKNLPLYFSKLNELLVAGGLILNHGITAGGIDNFRLSGGMGEFIGKHIFPGGELQHISHVLEVSSKAGLETLDVENLRPHYARTLWDWSDNLERQIHEAIRVTNERTVRTYRMYLAGCALGFEQGWTSLNQVLLTNSRKSTYPFNRGYMY